MPFSAALCRGLIEAVSVSMSSSCASRGFPRLYAAASLKRSHHRADEPYLSRFPRLYAAASLKQGRRVQQRLGRAVRFPRLYAAASLKQPVEQCIQVVPTLCFPRLYAAASLKRVPGGLPPPHPREFSAALCRGLIEARKG